MNFLSKVCHFAVIYQFVSVYINFVHPQTIVREMEKIGDLNIGILFPVYSSRNQPCLKLSTRLTLAVEMVQYYINKINSNSKMLPNITLGFIFLDTCGSINRPVQRLLEFLPNTCSNHGSLNNKVVGVIGPYLSDRCVPTAGLASQFELPVLATHATSEELSDVKRFSYFSRLAPPDSFVTVAMTNLIAKFEWNYIQLLYSEGLYAENMAKSLEKNAKKKGICVAHSHRFSPESPNEFIEVAKKVMKHKKAKIIVFLLSFYDAPAFLRELQKLVTTEKFIFISADDFFITKGFEKLLDRGMKIRYAMGRDDNFIQHLYNWKPAKNSHTWLIQLFELLGNCKYDTDCQKYKNLAQTGNYKPSESLFAQKVGDGVEVYSRALHNLILTTCPETFKNKSNLMVSL